MPDEQNRAMRRRLARRSQLVKARTRAKNECHAVLVRRLITKPAVSDLFGLAGRRWLREVELPSRGGLRPHRPRLAISHGDENGRECDTGARISKAL
jgi:hypothetical protein